MPFRGVNPYRRNALVGNALLGKNHTVALLLILIGDLDFAAASLKNRKPLLPKIIRDIIKFISDIIKIIREMVFRIPQGRRQG